MKVLSNSDELSKRQEKAWNAMNNLYSKYPHVLRKIAWHDFPDDYALKKWALNPALDNFYRVQTIVS